ncbi:cation:proton antiporter [Magnetospirillum sp. UT-4]|uniref:cation:proton antiporter domain-containing protein n=1 Tax=Magnetospirillum sp. UT-4 TaxID=2681467 RepID=UPI0013820925|nr:cation:proton antiporter [Magnetospirillum sp. UT-4]CAA7620125.1 Glutathione-regulated potassium-efflux system protein KefC [Magnetospirillum sp. UT-4]
MHNDIILDVLIFLGLAVTISPLCHRFRVSPVLGYLVAGSAIGPAGLALLPDSEGSRGLGELGIVFLLFTIGLELSWERLRVIRHFIFGLGSAQLLLTGTLAGLVLAGEGLSPAGAMVAGLAVAFSSTAFVLQLLSERGALASQHGRVAVAVLILQDLAVVPLLVAIPLLGEHAGGSALTLSLAQALAKAAAALAVILVVAHLGLRPLFRLVAATRSPEVFVAASLLAVIGTSTATEAVGLSHSLGAFLAGVLLASSEYRHQVEADLQPVRGLLMGLFFLTVGMTIDPTALLRHLPEIAAGVGVLVVLKALIITALALAFRFPLAMGLHLGLLLAQGGEFAFVVLARAGQNDLIPAETISTLTTIIALSMALTPALALLGEWIGRHHRLSRAVSAAPPDGGIEDLSDHVIIAGCGRAGQIVASILSAEAIPYVAIDRDPHLVEVLRGQDRPVFFGDVRKLEVLKAVGAERARALVLTIGAGSGREKLVPRVRQLYPALRILARARDRRQAKGLEASGATAVVPEILEGSLQLAGRALHQLGTPAEEVQSLLEEYRKHDYAKLALTLEKE